MFCDKNSNGLISQSFGSQELSEVTQENHYYPFGLNMEGVWANTPSVLDNKYMYNGKELNSDFGLEWNDYGLRMYDVATCRWNSIDKLTDLYRRSSPYCYVGNNPIRYLDVNGAYKFPSELFNGYPLFKAYLERRAEKDIMGSPTILAGLLKYSGGNLTFNKVSEATRWGSGPTVVVVNGPGPKGAPNNYAPGYYDNSSNTIQINKKLLDNLENADSDDARKKFMIAIYKTILHETVHYGDYIDGKQYRDEKGNSPEVGALFDDDVFFGEDVFYGGEKHRQVRAGVEMLNSVDKNINPNPIDTINKWGQFIQETRPNNWMELIPVLPKARIVNRLEPLPTKPIRPPRA